MHRSSKRRRSRRGSGVHSGSTRRLRRRSRRSIGPVPPVFWFAILTSITWLVGLHVPAYNTLIGPETLDYRPDQWQIQPESWVDPESADSKRWLTINGGQVVFKNNGVLLELEQRELLGVEYQFPLQRFSLGGQVHARITADLSTENVVAGRDFWHAAALHVKFLDKDDNRLQPIPFITAQDGTHRANSVSGVFGVPPAAETLGVWLRIVHSAGKVELSNIELSQVTPSDLFNWSRIALILAWIFASLLWLQRNLATAGSSAGVLLGIAVALLIVGVLIPRGFMSEMTSVIREYSQSVIIQSNWIATPGTMSHRIGEWVGSNTGIPKLGHAALFFVLSLVFNLSHRFRQIGFTQGFLWILVLAFATEGMQLFTEDRSGQLNDVGFDLAGALAGWLLAAIVRLPFRRAF